MVTVEKMEDTSLLPNPIIISIKSKTAFQFIELKDRDTLVENLLLRLKQVKASKPAVSNSLKGKDTVFKCPLHLFNVLGRQKKNCIFLFIASLIYNISHNLCILTLRCDIHKDRRNFKWKSSMKDIYRSVDRKLEYVVYF